MIPSVTDSPSDGRVTSANVQSPAGEREQCLTKRLGQRRVRLYERRRLFRGGLPVDGEVAGTELLSHPGTSHMHAQDLSRGAVGALFGNDLHHAFGVANYLSATVAAKGVLLHDNVVTLLLGFGFGEATERDFRI